jgi:predicted GIY-YIG superfamily endonuclease
MSFYLSRLSLFSVYRPIISVRNYSTAAPSTNPDLPCSITLTNLHEPETREAARKALAGRAGVYCIRSLKDGKSYIGSAVNLYARMSDHLWQDGSKSNLLLQRAIAKHGLENFEFRRRLRQMSAAAAAVCY